jgi:SAM-dependent methyltransferase
LKAFSMSSAPYTAEFYDGLSQGSLDSARIYLGHLFAAWTPQSVIDVGCGTGPWLAACEEQGVPRLVGLDGDWIKPDMILSKAAEFRTTNLQDGFVAERFELAISMEVAEHLPPESSEKFFGSLARLSDAILFSAAFCGQPGTNHINTRPHSFWAKKFLDDGYGLFDMFRPQFWSDARVFPWYRQNTFLYVKPAHQLYGLLLANGHRPSIDAGFVDCVHPWLYFILMGELRKHAQQAQAARPWAPGAPATAAKPLGRNDKCPCGSGKKYKQCHGRLA